jgi:hypothetical protein
MKCPIFRMPVTNQNEMPELQEFLENMETEVYNHYVILNKIETQYNTTDTAV